MGKCYCSTECFDHRNLYGPSERRPVICYMWTALLSDRLPAVKETRVHPLPRMLASIVLKDRTTDHGLHTHFHELVLFVGSLRSQVKTTATSIQTGISVTFPTTIPRPKNGSKRLRPMRPSGTSRNSFAEPRQARAFQQRPLGKCLTRKLLRLSMNRSHNLFDEGAVILPDLHKQLIRRDPL